MMLLFLISCAETPSLSLKRISPSTESMVLLDGGSFLMGYPDNEPGPYGNHWKETAQPQHSVELSNFWLDKTEVSVAQYSQFLDSLYQIHGMSMMAHHHPLQPIIWENQHFQSADGMSEHPINYVSWYDAATYCASLGKRLPTEAEFEYAIKGNDIETPRNYPWPEGGPNCQRAVYYTNLTLCEMQPAPVASRSPEGDTPEGISDLSGNVSEWVWDWSARYESAAVSNPTGPSEGTYKILRGGGFRETSDALRATDRVEADPSSRSEGIGFRCALSEVE